MAARGGSPERKLKWLCIVAVAQYAAGDHVMPSLPGVIEDANRLDDVLHHYSDAPFGDTIRLYNKQATHEAIFTALQNLADSARESDQVILYFGGHACRKLGGDHPMPDGMTSYLLPYEAIWETAAV